jgi:hypothetical protein
LAGRLRQELFEIFQKIRCRVEESSHLSVHVLNWLLLSLISLENLEELFVDLRLILEAILREAPVSDARADRPVTYEDLL